MSTITLNRHTAPAATQTGRATKGQAIAGRVVSTLLVALLAMDAVTHLLRPVYVDDAMKDLGWPVTTAPLIGVLLLLGLVLHVVPRTRVLGALVITGYLGGAVAAQVRIETPAAGAAFPVLVAALVWAGLGLRDPGTRRLLFPGR